MCLDPLSLGPKPHWARRTFLIRSFLVNHHHSPFSSPLLHFSSPLLFSSVRPHRHPPPACVKMVKSCTLPFATHTMPPPPSPLLPASTPPTSPHRHRNHRHLFDTHAPMHARFALFALRRHLSSLLSPLPCLRLRRAALYLACCQRHQRPPHRRRCLLRDHQDPKSLRS
jgi:hypothetical protein